MPPKNPWRHQIIQLVNKGLDLIHAVDQIDSEHFARLTNVESILEGDIQPRPGTSLINSAALTGGVASGGFTAPTQGDITGDGSNEWFKVTSAAGADTYGAWAEAIASTDYAGTWVMIAIVTNQQTIGLDNRFDVAIGAVSSEVAFITEMTYRFQRSGAGGGLQQMDISFPFVIPAGSRISIRNKDQDGSAHEMWCHVNILG